jgi:Ni,Fe-hydrogenase I cytochrome b subunit
MLSGFLFIHVYKDVSSEAAAWYFHSTPIWLIVMGIATVVYLLELRRLRSRGSDINQLFSELPDE